MKIKIPQKINYEKFFSSKKLDYIISASKEKRLFKDKRKQLLPYRPVLKDLHFLYQLVVLNKRISVLEYGSGWSTLILHLALMELKKKMKNEFYDRASYPFGIISVEDSKKFLKISKKRLDKYSLNNNYYKFYFSKTSITTFNDRYVVEYDKNPKINPDLILIDGPDQFNVKEYKDNFTIAHHSMVPILGNVLRFEHYLLPGTIILLDGRAANARFLKSNFQRNWKFVDLYKEYDLGLFYLDEKPLGEVNKKQLKYQGLF